MLEVHNRKRARDVLVLLKQLQAHEICSSCSNSDHQSTGDCSMLLCSLASDDLSKVNADAVVLPALLQRFDCLLSCCSFERRMNEARPACGCDLEGAVCKQALFEVGPSSVVRRLHFPWTDRDGTRPPETDYYISNESKLATMGESEIQAKIDEIGELSLFCFAEK